MDADKARPYEPKSCRRRRLPDLADPVLISRMIRSNRAVSIRQILFQIAGKALGLSALQLH
jgi:hypothetical protein